MERVARMSQWTAAQKRAYAIRKSKERRQELRRHTASLGVAPTRQPVGGYECHPDNHRCNERTIDYGNPDPLSSRCRACGRFWTRVTTGMDGLGKEYYRMEVTPLTKKMPPAS